MAFWVTLTTSKWQKGTLTGTVFDSEVTGKSGPGHSPRTRPKRLDGLRQFGTNSCKGRPHKSEGCRENRVSKFWKSLGIALVWNETLMVPGYTQCIIHMSCISFLLFTADVLKIRTNLTVGLLDPVQTTEEKRDEGKHRESLWPTSWKVQRPWSEPVKICEL